MNRNERQVVAALLKLARDHLAHQGCNDFDLRPLIPNKAERQALMKAYHEWNGDTHEYDSDHVDVVTDFALAGYLSSVVVGDDRQRDAGLLFLLRSLKHADGEYVVWWGPNRRGYVKNVADAGRYSLEEATAIMASSNGGGIINTTRVPLDEVLRFAVSMVPECNAPLSWKDGLCGHQWNLLAGHMCSVARSGTHTCKMHPNHSGPHKCSCGFQIEFFPFRAAKQ